ncbi:non-canonical purine NTP pyrophosphatase [Dongia sp.]|uniref:non-canonical purine NTP pyrophosphatase n=1 Tax=Dongia sp. TaxID=1977262 RepID=UPI003750F07A
MVLVPAAERHTALSGGPSTPTCSACVRPHSPDKPSPLADAPRGSCGHDPIFVPTGHDITFGEMDPAKKLEMSHRAVAFRMLVDGCFR